MEHGSADLKFIDQITVMKKILFLSFLVNSIAASAQVRPINAAVNKGVYTVPNTSFFPDLNLGYANGNAGDGIAYADGGTGVRMVASVQLPQGAIVDSIRSYFIDYSDNDMFISLASYENASNSGLKDIFTSTTTGKSMYVRSIKATATPVTIDNARFSYYLCVQGTTGWPKKPQVMGIRSVVFFYH